MRGLPGSGTIHAIEACSGEVDNPPFPDNRCRSYRALKPTRRCSYAGVTALARECPGKNRCDLDAWKVAKDPCSAPPYKLMKSTLMVRALCDSPHPAATALGVDSDVAGPPKLLFQVANQTVVRSASAVVPGEWTHVAVTYGAEGADKGRVTLYVNGAPEAEARDVRFPPAYRWDIGTGNTPAGDYFPTWIGAGPNNVRGWATWTTSSSTTASTTARSGASRFARSRSSRSPASRGCGRSSRPSAW